MWVYTHRVYVCTIFVSVYIVYFVCLYVSICVRLLCLYAQHLYKSIHIACIYISLCIEYMCKYVCVYMHHVCVYVCMYQHVPICICVSMCVACLYVYLYTQFLWAYILCAHISVQFLSHTLRATIIVSSTAPRTWQAQRAALHTNACPHPIAPLHLSALIYIISSFIEEFSTTSV